MTKSAPILDLSADRSLIQPGECQNYRRRVEGVKAVYYHAEGQRWQDHGVAGVGEHQVCRSLTTGCSLRVAKRDDSLEMRKITVQVRENFLQ